MVEVFKSDEEKAQEAQKARNERKYSDKLNKLQETDEAPHVVLQRLLEEYLCEKETSNHDDFCENLIAILGDIDSQKGDKWISVLSEYLYNNSINENLDLSELLNAFFKHYPKILKSIINLNSKCVSSFSNFPMIHITETVMNNSLEKNAEVYRCIAPIVFFFAPVKDGFKSHFKIYSKTHREYVKTISRVSRTCTSLNSALNDEEKSLNELGHWTVRGHLIKVDEKLKESPELANKKLTATALSDKHFDGFTGYQISIFERDKDMQAVYEKYMTIEQIEAQRNFLRENFDAHNQLGLYFNITPLREKMELLRTHFNDVSEYQRNEYWQKEIGGEYRKFPAWLVYAMCEVGLDVAWTQNDLKNMKVERQYGKGHLEWWFLKEYNGGKLGDCWVPGRHYSLSDGSPVFGSIADSLIDGGHVFGSIAVCVRVLFRDHDLEVIQSVEEAIRLEALNGPKANSENNSSMRMKRGL